MNQVNEEKNEAPRLDLPESIRSSSFIGRLLPGSETGGRSLFDNSFSYKYFSAFDNAST